MNLQEKLLLIVLNNVLDWGRMWKKSTLSSRLSKGTRYLIYYHSRGPKWCHELMGRNDMVREDVVRLLNISILIIIFSLSVYCISIVSIKKILIQIQYRVNWTYLLVDNIFLYSKWEVTLNSFFYFSCDFLDFFLDRFAFRLRPYFYIRIIEISRCPTQFTWAIHFHYL